MYIKIKHRLCMEIKLKKQNVFEKIIAIHDTNRLITFLSFLSLDISNCDARFYVHSREKMYFYSENI